MKMFSVLVGASQNQSGAFPGPGSAASSLFGRGAAGLPVLVQRRRRTGAGARPPSEQTRSPATDKEQACRGGASAESVQH